LEPVRETPTEKEIETISYPNKREKPRKSETDIAMMLKIIMNK
jgi:hypothetical protein